MSIESFIKKICVQTAVYWGSPVNDGYGGMVYNDPRDIKVRWEWMDRIRTDHEGKQMHQKGQVLVTEDLDVEGWLYLGSLNDFDSSVDETNPIGIQGSYQIIGFDKIPLIKSTTKFVRTVFFGFGNVQN